MTPQAESGLPIFDWTNCLDNTWYNKGIHTCKWPFYLLEGDLFKHYVLFVTIDNHAGFDFMYNYCIATVVHVHVHKVHALINNNLL